MLETDGRRAAVGKQQTQVSLRSTCAYGLQGSMERRRRREGEGKEGEEGRRGGRGGKGEKKLRGVKARAQTDRETWRVSASSPVMVHENRREGGGGKGRGQKGGGEGCANGRRDKREPQARTLSY